MCKPIIAASLIISPLSWVVRKFIRLSNLDPANSNTSHRGHDRSGWWFACRVRRHYSQPTLWRRLCQDAASQSYSCRTKQSKPNVGCLTMRSVPNDRMKGRLMSTSTNSLPSHGSVEPAVSWAAYQGRQGANNKTMLLLSLLWTNVSSSSSVLRSMLVGLSKAQLSRIQKLPSMAPDRA